MSFVRGENVVSFRGFSEARAIFQARDPSVLHSILQQIGAAGTAAVIWQRKPLAEFLDWINALSAEDLPTVRTLGIVDAVEDCVQAASPRAGTPWGRMRDMLARDIAALSHVRTIAASTAGCCHHRRLPKISLRQYDLPDAFTYLGSGTQLAQPGLEMAPLEVMTGAVAILRGARWPGCEKTACFTALLRSLARARAGSCWSLILARTIDRTRLFTDDTQPRHIAQTAQPWAAV